jgi:hypothetical protein
MIYLRACFRCRGDIVLDRDIHGAYFKCLQCGFSRDIPSPEEVREAAVPLHAAAVVFDATEAREEAA